MSEIVIEPAKLGEALANIAKEHRKALDSAAKAAALKLKAYLVQYTDELGITDTGVYKNSFVVTDNSVNNEAPHAGIVELGARPHAVSEEGRQAIKSWCMRKLGLDEKEAESASWAIANKIRMVGQTPRYVMRDSIPKAREFFNEEFSRIMKGLENKP